MLHRVRSPSTSALDRSPTDRNRKGTAGVHRALRSWPAPWLVSWLASWLGALVAFGGAAAADAAEPIRGVAVQPSVISINACTDQLLMTLADPDQILGITRFSRDPVQSPMAALAARLPVVSGTAEEVLAAQPTLVLAGRFTKRATRDFLRERGIRLIEFEPAHSLDEAKRQITEVAALVGHPDRAVAANLAIDEALAKARRKAAGHTGTVLPLQRRGWVSGQGTLTTSLIEAVGLKSAGGAISKGLGRMVDLETVVALRPDYLLLSSSGDAEDQGTALLQHPALLTLYPAERRLVLPDRMTSCGGPIIVSAIEALGEAVARLPR